MRFSYATLGIGLSAALLSGCLHGRGEHTVPVSRDYKALEDIRISDAEPKVDEAHRVGAHHFAPYEAESAKTYLEYAYDARSEGDRKGHKDYAGLALKYANEAIEKGSGIPDGGIMPTPANKEEGWAEWTRLRDRYLELDACKAKLVAPVIYAHIEANLAQAEHELIERCHYDQIIEHLNKVEPDIDSIWAMDADNDGVRDMDDGDPWIPEDPDGHDDGDGIPEPKPYPVLKDINFDTNKATLSGMAQGYLSGIAHMMKNGYKEATIHMGAHTDSDASDEYNQELSMRRETAVKDYLVGQGVDGNMIKSSHAGEASPKADNSTSSGKAANRRVELWLDSPDPTSPYCNE